jgi:hypothetical protein
VCAAAAGYHVGVRSTYSTACCHPRRARCSPPRSHSQPPHSRQVRATRQVSTPPWRGAGQQAWRGGLCARRVVRADPLSEVQHGLQPGLAQVCQEEPAQPSEIARAVAFLLDPDSAYHGSVLFVDGGTDAVLRPKRSDTPIGHASYGPSYTPAAAIWKSSEQTTATHDLMSAIATICVLAGDHRDLIRRSAIVSGLRQLSLWLGPGHNNSPASDRARVRVIQLRNLLAGRPPTASG